MSSEGVGGFASYDHRRFRFVLGTGRPATGAAAAPIAGARGGLVGVVFGVLRDLEVEIRAVVLEGLEIERGSGS